MVLYGRGLRGRPAGQAVVAEVEDAIDIYFKSSSPSDDVTKGQPKDYAWLQNTSGRISRSRPVIPPLLELHLIQLGNKLTIGEAEVARARFRRAVSVASLGPFSASGSHDFVTSCTDPEGNAVQSRASAGQPGANSVPRARCCNCPESSVAATDVVVDQLVRMMRKVVLDIMDDNATTTLLRARVSRQKLTATARDDRIRSSSSSSLSSSCSSSSSSSVSKVAIITPANEANNAMSSTAAAPSAAPPSADQPTASDFPSATSTPTCSSPSSLFSSPSSSSSSAEKRREGEGAMMRPDLRLSSPCNNEEEEESSAFGAAAEVASPPSPSRGASEIKHIEPIFLRCPKRVEENLAASHSFVRSREGGVVPPLRGSMSPRPKKTGHTTAGDELQMRLNAILHSSRRDCAEKNLRNCSASPRLVADGRLDDCQVPCPSSPVSQSSLSPYHYQMSADRNMDASKSSSIENGETTAMSFYDDASSHPFSLDYEGIPDHPSSPIYQSPHPSSGGMVGNPTAGMPSHGPGNHVESHSSWRDSEDELQRTCGPMYAKPPRYSIFTISGTLTDPFGTNAKYSLRSLSTAHF